jgi:hypothetical protein
MIAGQVGDEINVFVPRIFNHHHWPLKFQRGLYEYIHNYEI